MDSILADSLISVELGKFNLSRKDCSMNTESLNNIFGCYSVPENLNLEMKINLKNH